MPPLKRVESFAAFGEFIFLFGFYESYIPELLSAVTKLNLGVCTVMLARERFDTKLKMLDAAFHETVTNPDLLKTFDKMIINVNTANKTRNRYLHSELSFAYNFETISLKQISQKNLGKSPEFDLDIIHIDDVKKAIKEMNIAFQSFIQFIHKNFLNSSIHWGDNPA